MIDLKKTRENIAVKFYRIPAADKKEVVQELKNSGIKCIVVYHDHYYLHKTLINENNAKIINEVINQYYIPEILKYKSRMGRL